MEGSVYIGVAGWTIPQSCKGRCAGEDSHLHRYARALSCVEINSSFHRDHKSETYARWAASVPENFRFSVKLSKTFTHEGALRDSGSLLSERLAEYSALGDKWRVLLVQLPPKLEFTVRDADRFFKKLMNLVPHIKVALEPRHPSWSSEGAVRILSAHGVSKVLADPERCPARRYARLQLERRLRYYRLHGQPHLYRSPYEPETLQRIANKIARPYSPSEETWVIFDNTTLGHGTENALDLKAMLSRAPQG